MAEHTGGRDPRVDPIDGDVVVVLGMAHLRVLSRDGRKLMVRTPVKDVEMSIGRWRGTCACGVVESAAAAVRAARAGPYPEPQEPGETP